MPARAVSSTSPNAMRVAVGRGFDISGPFQRPLGLLHCGGGPDRMSAGVRETSQGSQSRGSCAGQVSFLTTLLCSRGHGLGVAMEPVMEPLKFVALDPDDLEVVSTHLQDAEVKVADVHWRPGEKRLVVAVDRFDWPAAIADVPQLRRCRAAL